VTEFRPEGHAFISYVREDSDLVDRLQGVLEAAGIRVWRDTEDLWPGQDWRIEINKAITSGSLAFLACFSESSVSRDKSYQNEELILAVEQMRRRPPGRSWLMPIRFADCKLPDFNLGAGRSLDSLQRIDLFDDKWEKGAARLVSAVLMILSNTPPPPSLKVAAGSTPGNETVERRLKSVLLDPNRQIELEDLLAETASEVRNRLLNTDEFPADSPKVTNGVDGIRYIVQQARRYEEATLPLLGLLALGCTWGRREHDGLWARTVQLIANARQSSGGKTVLINLQRYPLVLVIYAAALAAVHRQNFGALRAMTYDAKIRREDGSFPVIGAAHISTPFENAEVVAQVLAREDGAPVEDSAIERLQRGAESRRYTPVSDHLRTVLRPVFASLILDDQEFDEAFDQTEIYLGLIATDVSREAKRKTGRYLHGPWFGSYTWKYRYTETPPEQMLHQEQREAGGEWPPLKAGLFGGSMSRVTDTFEAFLPQAAQARSNRIF
jgi:hypothetical protein